MIDARGREVLRCLLQVHIVARNQGEAAVDEAVVGADEVERTHRIHSKRELLSIFAGRETARSS